MSQVVVTEDNLSEKRKKSLAEEKRIVADSYNKKWLRSNLDKNDPIVRKILTVALAPLFAAWGLLCAAIGATMWLFSQAMRGLGLLIGSRSK